ncbi:MAG: cytochrome C assembly protein [Chloroflexi bacterium]|nr:cytochrome C assembly protein [Chloroflexota bacterium]MDL1883793.1 cytochrome C assembly protein [Anaerolineae bacterium CFX8]
MTAVQDASALPTQQAETGSRPRLLVALTIITPLAVLVGLYMALFNARTDIDQGDVQRIFYIHMPAFIGAFVALGGTVIGGIQYLRTRQVKWDTLALAGVEVGIALALVNLVTGMVWARPIWNTWWTWDPRLTSEAIMVLTYAAYIMLRQGIENPEQRRRFAAVYGILAFITVIITLVITRIRPDTIHPVVIGPSVQTDMAQGAFEVAATSGVRTALMVNMPVWAVLVPITLMWYRIRLENFNQHIQALKMKALS